MNSSESSPRLSSSKSSKEELSFHEELMSHGSTFLKEELNISIASTDNNFSRFPDNFNREQTIIALNDKQSQFIIAARKEMYNIYLQHIEQGKSIIELPVNNLLWQNNKRKLVEEILNIFKKICVVYYSTNIAIKKPIIDMEELDDNINISKIILEFPTS